MIAILTVVLMLTALLPANAAEPSQTTACGPHYVTSIGSWTPADRKSHRPDDLWRHYMHGIVDHFATPVAWEDLFDSDAQAAQWLDPSEPLDTPYRKSNMPSIRIAGEKSVSLPRPLPIAPEAIQGKRIRLFVWLKGVDVGARNNCWHAPSLWVTMKDARGKVLTSSDSYFKTLRTYPWHCYYTDRFVPRNAAGVYVRLFNKFHGVAHFSTLSWEFIDETNTYSNDDKQDPQTGSLACNPIYDEMPEHLKKGFGFRHRWLFVTGAKAGLVGQPYDITTNEGFRKYYFEEAKTEPEHMNHAILHMGSMYRNGISRKMLPPMQEGWLGNFAQVLMDDQDPQTGFWHDGTNLSLGLTFHLCNMHFRYYEIGRTDRADRIRPSFDLGLKAVPRADRIIRTCLMMQSSYTDEEGTKRKAAWNWPAYRYTTEPDKYEQKCYLGTTWDAIYLTRLAARYVEPELQQQVYESVKAAFRYVLHACVLEDGSYKAHDTDEHPTKGDYMGGIMQDAAWLEHRVVAAIPQPRVSVTPAGEDALVFRWHDPAGDHNSLRIRVAEADLPSDKINDSHLAGIIHRTGR